MNTREPSGGNSEATLLEQFQKAARGPLSPSGSVGAASAAALNATAAVGLSSTRLKAYRQAIPLSVYRPSAATTLWRTAAASSVSLRMSSVPGDSVASRMSRNGVMAAALRSTWVPNLPSPGTQLARTLASSTKMPGLGFQSAIKKFATANLPSPGVKLARTLAGANMVSPGFQSAIRAFAVANLSNPEVQLARTVAAYAGASPPISDALKNFMPEFMGGGSLKVSFEELRQAVAVETMSPDEEKTLAAVRADEPLARSVAEWCGLSWPLEDRADERTVGFLAGLIVFWLVFIGLRGGSASLTDANMAAQILEAAGWGSGAGWAVVTKSRSVQAQLDKAKVDVDKGFES